MDVRKCSIFPIGRLSADENMWPWQLWSLVCQVGLQVVTEAKKFLKPGAFQGCCDGDGFKPKTWCLHWNYWKSIGLGYAVWLRWLLSHSEDYLDEKPWVEQKKATKSLDPTWSDSFFPGFCRKELEVTRQYQEAMLIKKKTYRDHSDILITGFSAHSRDDETNSNQGLMIIQVLWSPSSSAACDFGFK